MTTPHEPLTREQVEQLCERIRKEITWKHEIGYILDTDAALRARVEELEQIQAIDLNNNNEYREQVAKLTTQLATVTRDLTLYQQGGITEDVLRKQDGFIKVGHGCTIVLNTEWEEMRRQLQARDATIANREHV